jgi:hypothetical protein
MTRGGDSVPASIYVRGLAGLLIAAALLPEQPQAFAADAQAAGSTAELASWIDARASDHFATIGAAQPPLVDDATFLRRAYLDLLGTIPAVSEVRDFLDDQSDNKRGRLIDQLLDDPRCAAHLARTWRRVLVPQAAGPAALSGTVEAWLESQLAEGVAYDELARKLITAGGAEEQDGQDDEDEDGDEGEGESTASPAVAYLQATGGDPASVAGSVSRVFLGIRIECAQCHDHPFTDWTQADFWGLAAFFAGARYNRPATQEVPADQENPPSIDDRVTQITPPDIGKTFQAGYLWDMSETVEIPDDKLPRQAFADWLTSPENPHFAATAVNRVWQQLCGHGLTASVDDLDLASGAERAVVLDDLAAQFAAGGFQLKWLIGGICKSRPYQYAADQSAEVAGLVAVRPLKVLSPEQVFDAMEVALALPVSRIDEGPRYNGQRDQMIARMAEVVGTTPDEFRAGVPQMLMLMNGTVTADATSLDTSRTLRAVVDAPFLDDDEKIETLFLAALTRTPSPAEMRQLKDHVDRKSRAGAEGQAYSEIMWALINSPEFMLIR